MKDTKRKHLNNVKNLKEENIKYKIDYEVMRRQLISIRNQISDILGDKVIKMPDNSTEQEQIKHFLQTYYKGLSGIGDLDKVEKELKEKAERGIAKDVKKKLTQEDYNNVYKEATKNLIPEKELKGDQVNYKQEEATAEQQETADNQPKAGKCHNCQALGVYKRGFCFKCENEGTIGKAENIKDVKTTPEQQNFKCSKCGTDGDDEGSFKTRNGKVFCIDCLGGEVGWKASKDK